MESNANTFAKAKSERSKCLTKEQVMSWEQVPFPVLNDAQFVQWQSLLEDRTGMYVSFYHRSLLQSNLIIRMREIECEDFDQYYK